MRRNLQAEVPGVCGTFRSSRAAALLPAEALRPASSSPAAPPVQLPVLLGRPVWSRWSQFPPEEAGWSLVPPSEEFLVLAPSPEALPSQVSSKDPHPAAGGTAVSVCSCVQDVSESLRAGGGFAASNLQMVPAPLQLPVGHQASTSVRGGAEGGAAPLLQKHLHLDWSLMRPRTFIPPEELCF